MAGIGFTIDNQKEICYSYIAESPSGSQENSGAGLHVQKWKPKAPRRCCFGCHYQSDNAKTTGVRQVSKAQFKIRYDDIWGSIRI